MKTVIRNSYTPKTGDYCETIVVDKESGDAYVFDCDGIFTPMPQPVDVEDILRRAAEYTDETVAPIEEKLDTVEEGAQVNVIETITQNGQPLTVTDKTVNVTVPTKTSDLENDGSDGTDTYVESSELDEYYTKTETDDLIESETNAREIADSGLQEQIDAIAASSDVVDIVGTYAALQAYDTSTLSENDIIKVLTDETRDDAITYYRWTGSTWTYVGAEGPFYTKAETDAIFTPMSRTVNGKALSSDITLTAQDVGALPDSTVIPTVNDATLTIQKNGTTVGTFTANSATNQTANITVPTDTSDLNNDGDGQSPFATEDYVDLNGGKIDTIEINGTAQPIVNKTVDITVPTRTSDLTNDGDGNSTYVETDDLGAAAFSNQYADLDGLPTIPTVNDATLTIQKNGTDVATFTANSATNQTANITVPVNTSDLTNDSGFITSSALSNYYTKSETYSQGEVNSLINNLDIPTATSDLTNDSGFITLTDIPTASANDLGLIRIGTGLSIDQDGIVSVTSAGSVDWDDVTNRPTNVSYWTNDAGYITSAAIPTNVSSFTNDAGYITSAAIPSNVSAFTNDAGYITNSALGNYYTKSQTYSQQEVNALINTIAVPTKTSDLTNDGADGTSTYVETDELGAAAFSNSFNDLTDKPTIGNATITIQKNGASAGTFTTNATANKSINITVPTKTSDITNDSGFITSIPTASASTLGGIKVGDNLSIDANGVLSADAESITVDSALSTSSPNPVQNSVITAALNGKANSADLSAVATSGSYSDLSDKPTIPTVNNGTLTIQKNGTNVQTFTANQSSNATANITVPTDTNDLTNGAGYITSSGSITGNAATATKLSAGKTIALGTGATGTATSFDGSSNITIPVTDVKDAYVTWGGKPIYSAVSPDDAGCIDEFGHNKLAFLPANCIQVHYSTDGGSTWVDYGLTDAQKIQLVTDGDVYCRTGGSTAATSSNVTNLKVRIRIATAASTTTTGTGSLYTDWRKVLLNVNDPKSNCNMTMRYRTIANYKSGTETWVNSGTTYPVRGGTAWNSIPRPSGWPAFGGNYANQTSQIGQLEFVLSNTRLGTWGDKRGSICSIRMIGLSNWQMPSEMARTGRLYSIDAASKNATFPASIYAGSDISAYNIYYRGGTTYGHIGSSNTPFKDIYLSDGIYKGSYKLTLPDKAGTVALTSDIPGVFTGAGASAAGTTGIVPAPAAGDNTKFLSGDGTWKTVSQYELPIASANTLGGVKIGENLSITSTGILSADAQQIDVDSALSTTSENPVQNKVITTELNKKANSSSLATVATSGSYNDLSNKPTIDSALSTSSTNAVENKAVTTKINEIDRYYRSLVPVGTAITANKNLNTTEFLKVGKYYCSLDATVATLTNCPTTNAFMMEVFSPLTTTIDDETTSRWVYRVRILTTYMGKMYIQQVSSGATAGNFTYGAWEQFAYTDNIGNGTLTIQKNGTNVQTFTANATSNKTANITVPTKTSELSNDSNFVASGDLATVATSGSYNDLSNKPTIPTVNNATLTIQKNGSNVATFTANSAANKTANIQVPNLKTSNTDPGEGSALAADTFLGIYDIAPEDVDGARLVDATVTAAKLAGKAKIALETGASGAFAATDKGVLIVDEQFQNYNANADTTARISFSGASGTTVTPTASQRSGINYTRAHVFGLALVDAGDSVSWTTAYSSAGIISNGGFSLFIPCNW